MKKGMHFLQAAFEPSYHGRLDQANRHPNLRHFNRVGIRELAKSLYRPASLRRPDEQMPEKNRRPEAIS
jgi:hypothetical protein